jgi:6-phosphogluconolactonase (cycloisomerase 2 family)
MVAAGCSDEPLPLGENLDVTASVQGRSTPGAVYLMSNDAIENAILVYDRSATGALTAAGTVATGGVGTGGGLGNQASLVLTQDHRHLYAVNAGSHDVSAFRTGPNGLEPIGDPVPSGGEQPISLTVHGDLLYVLNAGGSGNVTGFHLDTDGSMSPIPGAIQPLGSDASGPAQILFTPNGRVLVVTEKATNTITTYVVGSNGIAGPPVAHPSAGETPFGFNFTQRGDLVVSEAFGGDADASTASSYRVHDDGSLTLVSGAVATTQTAACWIAIPTDGRFAFTTNTGSGTVSRLRISSDATLSLSDPAAGVTGPGARPQDAAFTPDGGFLYVRNANGTISAFRAEDHGGLTHIGEVGPLPAATNGIVAR